MGNHTPHGNQVFAITEDIHGRLHQVLETSAVSIEGKDEIVECNASLSNGITKSNDVSVGI